MYIKTYETKYGTMVAVADAELIGKKFKYKDGEFFVNPRFYQGEQASAVEVMAAVRDAATVNLVGRKSVECGKMAGGISEKNILWINKKIPHAQAVVMLENQ